MSLAEQLDMLCKPVEPVSYEWCANLLTTLRNHSDVKMVQVMPTSLIIHLHDRVSQEVNDDGPDIELSNIKIYINCEDMVARVYCNSNYDYHYIDGEHPGSGHPHLTSGGGVCIGDDFMQREALDDLNIPLYVTCVADFLTMWNAGDCYWDPNICEEEYEEYSPCEDCDGCLPCLYCSCNDCGDRDSRTCRDCGYFRLPLVDDALSRFNIWLRDSLYNCCNFEEYEDVINQTEDMIGVSIEERICDIARNLGEDDSSDMLYDAIKQEVEEYAGSVDSAEFVNIINDEICDE